MYLQALTDHQVHICEGVLVLVILFFGIIRVVTHLNKGGIKTYASRRESTNPAGTSNEREISKD
jgi:hypothetical protein